MPNHVTTRCTVKGTDNELAEFKALVIVIDEETKQQCFDFQRLIPMPPVVKNTICGSAVEYEDSSIADFEQRLKTRRPLTDEEKALAAGEGWYGWSVRNWGTKWNAYGYELEFCEGEAIGFSFVTAWSFPLPIFEGLAERFPGLTFDCVCFDEGWNFAGVGLFNGKPAFEFCDATDELYERVYGFPPETDEE